MKDEERRRHQQEGVDILGLLFAMSRAVVLHDANNATIVQQVDLLMERVEKGLEESEELRLQLLTDEFFWNGRLLRMDPTMHERAGALTAFLQQFGIGEICFDPGVTREQVAAFAHDLARSVRARANMLQPGGYGALHVGESPGQSLVALNLQPDRLAILVGGSLLELIEWLYAHRHEQASLLPLRRSLQLVIDAATENGPLFQVIAAVRNPCRTPGPSRFRLSVALEAIAFGTYLTLTRREVMILALAAVLGGLDPEPREAVRALLPFRGLKDLAVPVTLAVHDLRLARRGGEGGTAGELLALCELYHELTSAAATRRALPPAQALARMEQGVPGISSGAIRTFLDFKGPFPIGAPVVLSDGSRALVVGQGARPEERQRPVVLLLDEQGTFGTPLDLSLSGDLEVARAQDPAEIGFDLSTS